MYATLNTVLRPGKSLPGLLALAALGLTAPAAQAQNAYSQAVLAANPLAYFGLDSLNAPSKVNGFTTTFNGSATITAAGGGAPITSAPGNIGALLNGTSDTSGFGTGPSIGTSVGSANPTGAGTILGWFSLAQTPGAGGTNGIYYIAGRSQNGNDLDVQVQSDGKLYFYANGGGSVSSALPGAALNTYYFFAATEDPTTHISDLYINGSLAATSTGDVSSSLHTSEFTIGDSSVFNPRNFDGKIDEVALFNTALSANQIQTIYNAASAPNPVPEASTTGSLGLLLALGFGGLVLAAKRKKAASAL